MLIPLDIFVKYQENRDINEKRDTEKVMEMFSKEIITQVCNQYRIDREEVRKYL